MLYVMCDCPGSGKTTWCKKNLANAVYVSTDDIRAELFGTPEPGDRSQEKRVFDTFYGRIRKALIEGKDVVADATHTTERGRKKVLDCLPDGQKAVAIVMKTSLRDALYRNANRERVVPEHAVRRMFFRMQEERPRKEEGFSEIRLI